MTVCKMQEDTKMFGRSSQAATDMIYAQLNNGLTSCALSTLKEFQSPYPPRSILCSKRYYVALQSNSAVTLADGYTDGEYGVNKAVQERNDQC